MQKERVGKKIQKFIQKLSDLVLRVNVLPLGMSLENQ